MEPLRRRLEVAELASTEPRPRGRGMDKASTICLRPIGFNGAPTSRSGNGVGAAHVTEGQGRFNGAPTSRSGNVPWPRPLRSPRDPLQRSPDLAVGECPGHTGASSRPTSFNGAPTSRSGNGAASSRTGARSCGFNGAPTSRSGNDALARRRERRLFSLQRSPDLAVGEWRRTRGKVFSWPSFNGAPTSRSGNGKHGRGPSTGARASTEPRPRGRGMKTAQAVGMAPYALQRSPDLAVGEWSSRSGGAERIHWLQRSPDLAVGECRSVW